MFRTSIRSKVSAALIVPVVATATLLGTAQVAFGKSSPSPVPVVKFFKASKISFTDLGGKLVLAADLKYAKTCSITVSPGIKGFSRTFSCSSDAVSKTVVLPPNETASAISYTFGLTVKNSGGSVMATNVVVSEAAAPPPAVKWFRASKATVTNLGGRVVLTAGLKSAETCQMTVSPAIKGFGRSFSCSSDLVTRDLTLAPNKTENPISYTFGLNVKNTAGSATATTIVVSEAAAPPPISFTTPTGSSTTLTFASEGVFVADDPLIVTVHNNGPITQQISSVTIGTAGDPSDFILNRNNCTYITAHETCSLAVQFQPSGAGLRTGVVDVVDSSWGTSGAMATLRLQGVGVWATATLENSNISGGTLSFPAADGVGSSSSEQFVTVYNSGGVPLYVDGITDTGADATDFSVQYANCVNPLTSSFPLIVGLGQNCTFGVTFAPSAPGTRTTNVVVDDNTLGTQTQLPVRGTGAYAATTLSITGNSENSSETGGGTSPISYNFTSVTQPSYDTVVSATLTVENTGQVTLAFDGVSVTGTNPYDFTITGSQACGDAGAKLIALQSCTMTITYSPQAAGTAVAVLNIADNTEAGGEVIDVTGTETTP